MNTIALSCSVVLTAAAVLAQCPYTNVTLTSNGQGCNPVFAAPPTYSVALDATNCTLQVTVQAFPGCCNTYLMGRMLALGDQPAAIPLPELGVGCTLLVLPVILLYQPASVGDTFVLTLPATLPPLSFHAQAAAHYFTTIGFTNDFALTAGGQVTLQ